MIPRSRHSLILLALILQSCAVSRHAVSDAYPEIKDGYSPEGHLEEVFFPSSEPGMTKRRAFVYLPKNYHRNNSRYPALYLLHGARGNECSWIERASLLHNIDSLLRCGAMLPTIVVLPNMNQYKDARDYGKSRPKGALESFFEVDGTVESSFLKDVVATTDSLFRTIPDKEHRAVAGLSIGAMQSIHLSANHPESFGYVGIFSPMVHSFIKPGEDNKFYRSLAKKQKVQFKNPPKLYLIMIGRADFYHPSAERWTKRLRGKGYPHEYVCVDGGHEWKNWAEFCNQFMQRLWK